MSTSNSDILRAYYLSNRVTVQTGVYVGTSAWAFDSDANLFVGGPRIDSVVPTLPPRPSAPEIPDPTVAPKRKLKL